jgi:hypothetical protein
MPLWGVVDHGWWASARCHIVAQRAMAARRWLGPYLRGHAAGLGCLHAADCVFDEETVLRDDAKPGRSGQENFPGAVSPRVRLARAKSRPEMSTLKN